MSLLNGHLNNFIRTFYTSVPHVWHLLVCAFVNVYLIVTRITDQIFLYMYNNISNGDNTGQTTHQFVLKSNHSCSHGYDKLLTLAYRTSYFAQHKAWTFISQREFSRRNWSLWKSTYWFRRSSLVDGWYLGNLESHDLQYKRSYSICCEHSFWLCTCTSWRIVDKLLRC